MCVSYAYTYTYTHTHTQTHTHTVMYHDTHSGYQRYISNEGAHALLITASHKFYLREESSKKEGTLTSDSQ